MAQNMRSVMRALNANIIKKEKQVKGAVSWSLNRAARMAKTRIVRGVAREHKLQNKTVKERLYIGNANPKDLLARVTAYGAPLTAKSAGKVRVMKRTGLVKAGKYTFPGAFWASGEKGYGRYRKGRGYGSTSLDQYHVMQRTSDERYPLEVIKIHINPTVRKITPKVCKRIMENEFPRIAEREIGRRVK